MPNNSLLQSQLLHLQLGATPCLCVLPVCVSKIRRHTVCIILWSKMGCWNIFPTKCSIPWSDQYKDYNHKVTIVSNLENTFFWDLRLEVLSFNLLTKSGFKDTSTRRSILEISRTTALTMDPISTECPPTARFCQTKQYKYNSSVTMMFSYT